MSTEPRWHEIEQSPGSPLVETCDPKQVDDSRARVYQSYERFLRAQLEMMEKGRGTLWNRNYLSIEAYLKSVEPMRGRLKQMLGFWIEPAARPAIFKRDRQVLMTTKDFRAERFFYEI